MTNGRYFLPKIDDNDENHEWCKLRMDEGDGITRIVYL